jgi:hypothetical protein
LGRSMGLREIITRALLDSPRLPARETVARLHRESSLRLEWASQGPAGLFREAEAGEHLGILEGWQESLRLLAPDGEAHARLVHFGRAMANQPAREIRDALAIPLDGGLIAEIHGPTNLFLAPPGQARESLIFLPRSLDKRFQGKHWLSVFLDHVILAAAGISEHGHAGRLIPPEIAKKGPPRLRFAPLSAARAREYLRDLVHDLLRGTTDVSGHPSGLHAYLLPCEAVFAHHERNIPVGDAVNELRAQCAEDEHTSISTQRGPIRDALDRWDPPSDEDAERMVSTRFGLYFATQEPETA